MDAQGDKAILSLPRDSRSPKETVVRSLLAHIAEPIETADRRRMRRRTLRLDVAARSATRSEEHTSELQSLMRISYAVFCLKKKKHHHTILHMPQTLSTPTTHPTF